MYIYNSFISIKMSDVHNGRWSGPEELVQSGLGGYFR